MKIHIYIQVSPKTLWLGSNYLDGFFYMHTNRSGFIAAISKIAVSGLLEDPVLILKLKTPFACGLISNLGGAKKGLGDFHKVMGYWKC